jgi:hypothetical protein
MIEEKDRPSRSDVALPVLVTAVTEDVGNLPTLVIHGATPLKNVGGETSNVRYTINVGQQLMRPKTVSWDFTILWDPETGGKATELLYKMYIQGTSSEWVAINGPSTGVLSRGGNNFKNITLNFSTEVLGTFSSYLIIENISNFTGEKILVLYLCVSLNIFELFFIADIKTIRMDMSVVTGENVMKSIEGSKDSNKLFSLKVESSYAVKRNVDKDAARSSVPIVDMGCCFFNRIYHNRKLVLVNHSDIVLDFILSSNASQNLVDLYFSKSSTSLKMISSIQVKPNSSLEVYLHFCARASAEAVVENSRSVAVARTIEVYVTCRFVKTYCFLFLLSNDSLF